MKIRQKMILNNILVGILPLLILSLIILLLFRKEEHTYIRKNLETYANTFKIALESDLEKYRNYTYFISHQNFRFDNTGAKYNFRLSDESMFGTRYKIRMYEIFLGNTNVYRDIYNWRDSFYSASQNTIDHLWKHLLLPRYTRRYTTSIPEIVSNTLVLRNCSIIYDYAANTKIGFTEIVTPLDYDYFAEFAFQEYEVIYFIETSGGYVFSHPDFNTPESAARLTNVDFKNSGKLPRIMMNNKREYYYFKAPLMQIPDMERINEPHDKPWSYIGILYDVRLKNKQFFQFQNMTIISILISVIILTIISYIFSSNLTRPLRKLERDIKVFDKHLIPISDPVVVNDEISSIHHSIASMTTHIVENTKLIQEEKNKLQLQQDIMDSELEMARQIQKNLLPASSPRNNIRFYYQAMEQLGGDYFHFGSLGKDRVIIFISDVSGHGVPAALITTMLNSFIFQNQHLSDKPEHFLEGLNHFLIHQASQNFVTALYGILDLKRLTFDFSVAGHGMPYLIRGFHISCPLVQHRGFPLGVLPSSDLKYFDKEYAMQHMDLEAGDQLLFTTDGVEECVNYKKHDRSPQKSLEEFGDQALFSTIHEHKKRNNKDLLRSLKKGLIKFRGKESFDDDVCMIVIDIE